MLSPTEVRSKFEEVAVSYELSTSALIGANALNTLLQAQVDRLTAELAAYQLKPLDVLAGLQNRNREPTVFGLAPNTERKWSDLHTAPGVFNRANFEALLAKGPFRFRPMMGRWAPKFVKDAAGTFTYVEPQGGDIVTDMVRWWENPAMDAASEFNEFLREYDADLHHLWGASPMSYYAEPMQRGLASPVTRDNLRAAGFTADKDLVAQRRLISSLARFKSTRVGIAFNPYQRLNPDGSWVSDKDTMVTLMTEFRAAVPNGVLHNCSFRESFLKNPVTANGGVYGAMFALGAPYSVQTAMLSLVGNLRLCLNYLSGAGFHAVELPAGHDLTDAEVKSYDTLLKANA